MVADRLFQSVDVRISKTAVKLTADVTQRRVQMSPSAKYKPLFAHIVE